MGLGRRAPGPCPDDAKRGASRAAKINHSADHAELTALMPHDNGEVAFSRHGSTVLAGVVSNVINTSVAWPVPDVSLYAGCANGCTAPHHPAGAEIGARNGGPGKVPGANFDSLRAWFGSSPLFLCLVHNMTQDRGVPGVDKDVRRPVDCCRQWAVGWDFVLITESILPTPSSVSRSRLGPNP